MTASHSLREYDGGAHKAVCPNRPRYIALSILFGDTDHPYPLPATAEEAADIIRWHESTRPH